MDLVIEGKGTEIIQIYGVEVTEDRYYSIHNLHGQNSRFCGFYEIFMVEVYSLDGVLVKVWEGFFKNFSTSYGSRQVVII